MKRSENLKWLDRAVVIGLGSNLPGEYRSSEALLEVAANRLASLGLEVVVRSSWWRSVAWPDPSDPSFVNGVALIETKLEPGEVLKLLRQVEHEFGRRRGAANGPRTLDLDLIGHGRQIIAADALVVPHPRAHERAFVMRPLAEIAPDWRHPVNGRTASDLARAAPIGAEVSREGDVRCTKAAETLSRGPRPPNNS